MCSSQEQAMYCFLTWLCFVQVIKAQHSHQGRGGATIQVELRDVDTGNKITERFRTDEALESMIPPPLFFSEKPTLLAKLS